MSSYFEDLQDLDFEKYPGFELDDYYSIYNREYDLRLVMHNNNWYDIHEEDEADYLDQDEIIYTLGTAWYAKFDLYQFFKDVKTGSINPDNFDITEYEF